MIRECIPLLLENHELTSDQAKATMKEIMSGEATPSQVAAFLIGLKKKRETAEEVAALAQLTQEFGRTIHPKVECYLLNPCGTGGDRAKTFNVSTTAAFVIAADGAIVGSALVRIVGEHLGEQWEAATQLKNTVQSLKEATRLRSD